MVTTSDVNFDPVDWDEDERLLHQGQPFTGEAVEILEDQLTYQEFYENGVPHGSVREWWPDGTPKSEGQVRHGLPYGTFREWHENGRLAIEKKFGDRGQLVTVDKWDEHGSRIS
ncbi:hypothetical protein GV792_19700 [Nocardia cyriacigeorgica]|nr:hypothetical protein [Nocardia cyriacigeorgica]